MRTPWWSSYFCFRPRRMEMVSSTVGSLTITAWNRRARARSFSMCLRYSSSVVAPHKCKSPRARAGLRMLPASMEPPPERPRPRIMCSSSIKRMSPCSDCSTSFSTAFSRSSNSPWYLAPAIKAARSREMTRLPLTESGTSPLMMRCASPSMIAVLPTPGSPMRHGLFFVLRLRICKVRRISSSRPMTGSNLPASARAVTSTEYFFRFSPFGMAFGSTHVLPEPDQRIDTACWPCSSGIAAAPIMPARKKRAEVEVAAAILPTKRAEGGSRAAGRACIDALRRTRIIPDDILCVVAVAVLLFVCGCQVPMCFPCGC
eukprot:m.137219 g.137219  ORF g.137219 m.137219 type:complete len:316 (+) comp16600_c1_seq1:3077-4024(+)